jgi:hypothetical protein
MRLPKKVSHRLIDLNAAIKLLERSKSWDDIDKPKHSARLRKLAKTVSYEAENLERSVRNVTN